MNTSAKYQRNWTETVGVARTKFCSQTDRPSDRQADSSILPPPHFVCGGLMNEWCFKARRQLRSYWAHLHIKGPLSYIPKMQKES